MSGKAIIKSLSDKVELLIKEAGSLRSERDALAAKGERLAAENRKLRQTVAELEKRIKVLELGGSFSGGYGDTKQAKARINRLVREIDKCIALMNR